MTAVTTHICDWKECKKERAGRSLHVFSHTTPNPSGNGRVSWQARFDLCGDHLCSFVRILTEEMESGRGKTVQKTPLEIVKVLGISHEVV